VSHQLTSDETQKIKQFLAHPKRCAPFCSTQVLLNSFAILNHQYQNRIAPKQFRMKQFRMKQPHIKHSRLKLFTFQSITFLCLTIIALPCNLAFALESSSIQKTSMHYRYWDWTKTTKRDDYQVSALGLALEKTKEQYGPYKITRVTKQFSTSRARREVNRGVLLNIHGGPWRPVETSSGNLAENNIAVNVTLLNGLLGYRSLFIRREEVDKFNHLTSAEELQKLTVGQGRGWVDVDIYKENKITVDDSATYYLLFPMLLGKRFDYIAMSVLEVDSILKNQSDLKDKIAVAENLVLYYPLPVIFYVSPQEPIMAKRVEEGLTIAKNDGSLDKLFYDYFKPEVEKLKRGKPRYFVLKNSLIPKELREERPVFLE
jgi:hypothetical protein